jgi:hypothetical protein
LETYGTDWHTKAPLSQSIAPRPFWAAKQLSSPYHPARLSSVPARSNGHAHQRSPFITPKIYSMFVEGGVNQGPEGIVRLSALVKRRIAHSRRTEGQRNFTPSTRDGCAPYGNPLRKRANGPTSKTMLPSKAQKSLCSHSISFS